MKVGNKVLGLAIGQKSILVAEVIAKGDQQTVGHVGEFAFPDGLSLSQPEKLGQALAQFLKSNRFSAKDTIIGLPAKRLVTRRKEIPPAAPAVAASTLRLQAEGEFSSELDNLVMDFAGTPSAAESTTVLLVATNKVVIDECEELARSAGLRLHGITSTGAALGRATSRLPGGDGWVLNLGATSAELMVQHGLDPTHLRHLSVMGGGAPEAIGALAGEIRRTMASIPKNGTPMTLALWNTSGSENPQSLLEQRLSMPVTSPELRTLVASDQPVPDAYVPAVVLALSARESAGLPLDFLHSRLAPPREPAISLTKKLGIAAGILLLGAIGAGLWVLNSKGNELTRLEALNTNQKHRAEVAQAALDYKRYSDAVEKLPNSAHFAAVWKELTWVFPPQANTIWVTNLSRLSDTWELRGEAPDETRAPDLIKSMLAYVKNGKHVFPQAQLSRGDMDPQSRLYKFTIRFQYALE